MLGITRDSIISICRNLDFPVSINTFTLDDLLNADEIFFTGTASEVTPVRSIDDTLIGNGEVGAITSKLKSQYMDVVLGKDGDYSNWLSLI